MYTYEAISRIRIQLRIYNAKKLRILKETKLVNRCYELNCKKIFLFRSIVVGLEKRLVCTIEDKRAVDCVWLDEGVDTLQVETDFSMTTII